MKKNLKKILLLVAVVVTAVLCLAFSASAKTWGDYEYTVADNIVRITKYTGNDVEVTVPAKIKNKAVKYIDWRAFAFNVKIKRVILSEGIEAIMSSAFEGCTSLENVVFPKTLRRISMASFNGCKALKEVTIPSNVTLVGLAAFEGCTALKELVILDGVSTLGGSFAGCTNLETVVIPESMEYIDRSCFGGCEKIKDVYYKGTKRQWKKITIGEYNDNLTNAKIHYGKIYMNELSTTLSKTSYAYNGKVRTPSVTVKDSKGNILKNGTDYTVKYDSGRKATGKYTVTVTFKGKYEGTKTLYFTIALAVPVLSKTSQSVDAIRLTWNKVTGVDGYRVYQYNAKTKKYEKIKTLTGTTYRIAKLKSGTTYKFKIKAYKKDGATMLWSAATSTITVATKPATPKITKLTTTKGKATFTWSNVAGESGYQVYYSTKKDSGFKKVATYKADVVKGSKSKLTSGKTYYLKVRAYKTVGNTKVYSAWSAVKAIKIK